VQAACMSPAKARPFWANLLKPLSFLRKPDGAYLQDEWKAMARALEPHLEMIHGCAQALRLKLELLKVHSKNEVDHMVKNLLSKLPPRLSEDVIESEKMATAFEQAEAELEQEHHTYLGLLDVIKGLFMWVENTEERVHKNISLS
jgi:hypothetical protein